MNGGHPIMEIETWDVPDCNARTTAVVVDSRFFRHGRAKLNQGFSEALDTYIRLFACVF
jgi:hypothetical protein